MTAGEIILVAFSVTIGIICLVAVWLRIGAFCLEATDRGGGWPPVLLIMGTTVTAILAMSGMIQVIVKLAAPPLIP